MTFLNQSFLPLLAPLLALPLLIHLFNRRFPLWIPFPDIARIKRSLSERSRLARWRHLLMTLLRTLAVAALLIAFLRPVLPRFGSKLQTGKSETGRRVLLVLDRSLSMEQRNSGGTSAARNAAVEAEKILATLTGKDLASIIAVGAMPETLVPQFTSQHSEISAAIATLSPSAELADMQKAIALAASLLGDKGAAEVYFLSDFQRTNWADVSFDELPKSARLFFVDTAYGQDRENTALLSVVPSSTSMSASENVKLDVTFGNYTSAPVTVPVEAVLDGHLSTNGQIIAPAWSQGRVTLSLTAPGEGTHTVEVRTSDDALPADNRRYLTLDVRRREEVLILCDGDADAKGARFLQTALNPYEENEGAFMPRLMRSAEVTPAQLATASKVVLTSVGQLSGDIISRLDGFLEKGGGLVYFLDGKTDRENIASLDALAGRASMPFQLAGQLTSENLASGAQKIAKGDFKSRFLKLFRGTNRQVLSRLEFYQMQRAIPTGEGEVLLNYADGTPALGVAHIGLGTALLCNFAPAELASNIARQRIFPAWIQEMVKNLTPDDLPAELHLAGIPVSAEVWRRDLQKNSVQDPAGHAVVANVSSDGERAAMSFKPMRTGVYALRDGNKLLWAAAVNTSEQEADLRRVDTAEISRRASAGRDAAGYFVNGAQDYDELNKGRPLFQWFVLGASALLLAEMLLALVFHRKTKGAAVSS